MDVFVLFVFSFLYMQPDINVTNDAYFFAGNVTSYKGSILSTDLS